LSESTRILCTLRNGRPVEANQWSRRDSFADARVSTPEPPERPSLFCRYFADNR
jgi:hypothetical protein